MKWIKCFITIAISALWLIGGTVLHAESLQSQIDIIKQVNKEGKGHKQAISAFKSLIQSGPEVLLPLAEQFQNANPLASNWLRNAFEAIADRAIREGKTLPGKELELFVEDTKQDPRARRMVYDWIVKVDSSVKERLIPNMIHDPSPDFRRDAVALFVKQGNQLLAKKKKEEAKKLFQKALSGAVHDDQVKSLVKSLGQLGEEISVQEHFGFINSWQIIGPFNNKDKVGFKAVYPPEKKVETNASYKGQKGKVSWEPINTDDDYGLINIAKQIFNHKGSCMYAATMVTCDREQEVQFRLGTPNAWKMWLNDELQFEREEYHRGTAMDQYRVPVKLKKGQNLILLKICQNEQTDSWAQRYQFQLRITDESGSALRFPTAKFVSIESP